MKTTLYAQPYDISVAGFYFETAEEYRQNAPKCLNDLNTSVEEFEIQFIEGESIDADLFKAIGVNQCNFEDYLKACDEWSEHEKYQVVIARENGYSFNFKENTPTEFDIEIYEMDSLKELAEYFVDEGLFGEIPKQFQYYIDYEAIARDLGFDYSEITIDSKNLVYGSS